MDALSHIFNFPETRAENRGKCECAIPVNILDCPMEYIFYMDVPDLSKSDIQVMVEDDNTLVIRSNGKRKREDDEEKGCKYTRLEIRAAGRENEGIPKKFSSQKAKVTQELGNRGGTGY